MTAHNDGEWLNETLLHRRLQRAAACYQKADFLTEPLADELMERLDFMRINPACIVDLGARIGVTSQQLRKRYPEAEIIALDAVPELLAQIPSDTVTTTCQVTDNSVLPVKNSSVDLIISNGFLHQVNDMGALLSECFRVLKPNGLLLFTLLGPDTLHELAHSFTAIDNRPVTRVHPFMDMHHIGDMLVKIGFLDPVMDKYDTTVTYTTINQLVKDIKALGMSNAALDRPRGLLTPKRWQAVVSAYEQHRTDGVLPASLEIVHGHAWKPEAKAQAKINADGEALIDADHIRPRS